MKRSSGAAEEIAGHFLPPSLLDSQLATLEKPGPDEDAVILDISHNVPTLLVEAVQSVGR